MNTNHPPDGTAAVDAMSREELAAYVALHGSVGRLARALGLSSYKLSLLTEGRKPISLETAAQLRSLPPPPPAPPKAVRPGHALGARTVDALLAPFLVSLRALEGSPQ